MATRRSRAVTAIGGLVLALGGARVALADEPSLAGGGIEALLYADGDPPPPAWLVPGLPSSVYGLIAPLYEERRWSVEAYAATTADTSMAGVSAGGRAAWENGLCRLLGAAADGQLGAPDARTRRRDRACGPTATSSPSARRVSTGSRSAAGRTS